MARQFDSAVGEYITWADSSALRNASTAFTALFAFRTRSIDGNDGSCIFHKGQNAFNNPSYQVRRSATNGNDRRYEFRMNIGGTIYTTGETAQITAETWYYGVARWESGGTLLLEIRDSSYVLVTSATSAGTATGSVSYSSESLYFGRDAFGYWAGDLENVRFYATRLSDATVEAELDDGADDTSAFLHSKMYDAGGVGNDPEPDSSGNGGSGTLTNTPAYVTGPAWITYGGSSYGELSGTVTSTHSASGTLSGLGELSGTSTSTHSASGTLSALGNLTGTSTSTHSAAGTLSGLGELSGTVTSSASVSGTVTALGELEATATSSHVVAGTLTALGELSGTVTSTHAASGTLTDANATNSSAASSFFLLF